MFTKLAGGHSQNLRRRNNAQTYHDKRPARKRKNHMG